ncbi:MAG TPA: sigma-54 dependent transcriptional regulator [Candidatus Binataceae bacterium]
MPVEKRILVAEDDTATHEEWRELLESWGYKVVVAEDGEKALEQIKSFDPHILLTDLKMPNRDGLQLLRDINELGLRLITLVISGAGDIPEAVEAIKLGALDYMRKPIDPPHLRQSLKTLTDYIDTREENRLLRRQLSEVGQVGLMFGKSLAMRRVIGAIEQLADSSASVVITGESGTGKELAARTIHDLSPRRNAPYIGVNCAAMPDTLIESELFGHERGAFTGADRRKEGCFELANGGTLLLDELGEMKIELQAKLLRVIEEQRLRRVGGTTEVPLNVRVLAASNRDMERAVKEGKLREDLFYRLSVFSITMPPLRDRIEDVPLLTEAFIRYYSERDRKQIVGAHEDTLVALRNHPWPGNVRQLRNVIERALVVAKGPLITPNDLPTEFRWGGKSEASQVQVRLGTTIDDAERELITRTIEFAGGNKTRAAEILGISAKTLYNKLERYEKE